MTEIKIQLSNADLKTLEETAQQEDKTLDEFIHAWIAQLSSRKDDRDVTQDPVFQMEGYDADSPADLSENLDAYLYGEGAPE